jgi:hypothetical protein
MTHLVAQYRPSDPDHAGMPWDMAWLDVHLPRLMGPGYAGVAQVSLDTSEGSLVRLNGYDRIVADRAGMARALADGTLDTYISHLIASARQNVPRTH